MSHRFVVFVLCWLFFTTASLRADEIAGRVLLPDGKPAVGAKVIARQTHLSLSPFWKLRDETVETATDANGNFKTTIGKLSIWAGPGRWVRPYLLIDAPNCALHFLPLVSVLTHNGDSGKDIQLEKNKPYRGIVVGEKGKPVAGARVAVTSLGNGIESSALNSIGQISTTQLTAVTGATGKFTLRGIAPSPEGKPGFSFSSVMLWASATKGANIWSGSSGFWVDDSAKRLFKEKGINLTLRPMETLRAKLVNDETGKPLAGIAVTAGKPSPVVVGQTYTLGDGSFTVSGFAPATFSVHFLANPADAALPSYQRKYESVEVVAPPATQKKPSPTPIIRVPSFVRVAGSFVDEETGKTPDAPLYGWATSAPVVRSGITFFMRARYLEVKDNAFSFSAPVGAITFSLYDAARSNPVYAAPRQSITVPRSGLQNMVFKVRRNPGFFVRLKPRDAQTRLPTGHYWLHWRRADGTQGMKDFASDANGEYVFMKANQWGEAVEMRVVREHIQLTPWTRAIADQKTWPLVFEIGEKDSP